MKPPRPSAAVGFTSVIHMGDTSVHIAGELSTWPEKDGMAAILRDAGLRVYAGRYSIRIENCSHFVFAEYGGDLGKPRIDADAASLDEMLRDGKLVSDALARARIRHRFELYDAANKLIGYLHHDWPLGP
ncbi:MAG TPA: hypothetical protein VK968_19425 [Roseimicrobium sp.]|nr:hypothetical protein [Roseimicrobium sp.]